MSLKIITRFVTQDKTCIHRITGLDYRPEQNQIEYLQVDSPYQLFQKVLILGYNSYIGTDGFEHRDVWCVPEGGTISSEEMQEQVMKVWQARWPKK